MKKYVAMGDELEKSSAMMGMFTGVMVATKTARLNPFTVATVGLQIDATLLAGTAKKILEKHAMMRTEMMEMGVLRLAN